MRGTQTLKYTPSHMRLTGGMCTVDTGYPLVTVARQERESIKYKLVLTSSGLCITLLHYFSFTIAWLHPQTVYFSFSILCTLCLSFGVLHTTQQFDIYTDYLSIYVCILNHCSYSDHLFCQVSLYPPIILVKTNLLSYHRTAAVYRQAVL